MNPLANNTPRPLVSVVMPTYNGARYLAEALDSVAAQHVHGGLEALAVDDGSTDATLQMLQAAAERLPLRILDGPRRRNWVASTNTALEAARGTYVCMLHQDDRWHPDRLARLTALAARQPEVDVWVHPVRFIGPDGRVVGRWDCPWPRSRVLPPSVWYPRLLVQNVLAVPAVFFRRELLSTVGTMDDDQRYTADWDFWLRMARYHNAWVLPESLADFRVHADSQTLAEIRKHAAFVEQLERVWQHHRPGLAELGAPARYDRMAGLGVEVNAWLAARAVRVPWPSGRLLRAVAHAGVVGSLSYLRASQVVPRTVARLRVRRQAAEVFLQPQ